MHPSKSESIFHAHSKIRLPIWIRTVILTTGILCALAIHDFVYLLCCSLFGFALMLIDRVSFSRFIIPFILLINLLMLSLICFFFGLDLKVIAIPGLKAFLGSTFLSWFGGTVSWSHMKKKYFKREPAYSFARFLDTGILYSQNLMTQIQKRFDAAYIRLGRKWKNPEVLSSALAGGIAYSFQRTEVIDESRITRLGAGAQNHDPKPSTDRESQTHLKVQQLIVENHTKRRLLDSIDFSLIPGEWLLVAGPSGSGKTTLLRAISGLEKAAFGQIQLTNTSKVKYRVPNDKVGFLFQNPDDQFFALTPYEDIIWGLRGRGLEENQASKIANDYLTKLDIFHLAHQPIAHLSFGEKKIAAMASILALETPILLCDEPTSGIDPETSIHLIAALQRILVERQTIVIWVSHDLHLVPKNCSKILLLKESKQNVFGDLRDMELRSYLVEAGLMTKSEHVLSDFLPKTV